MKDKVVERKRERERWRRGEVGAFDEIYENVTLIRWYSGTLILLYLSHLVDLWFPLIIRNEEYMTYKCCANWLQFRGDWNGLDFNKFILKFEIYWFCGKIQNFFFSHSHHIFPPQSWINACPYRLNTKWLLSYANNDRNEPKVGYFVNIWVKFNGNLIWKDFPLRMAKIFHHLCLFYESSRVTRHDPKLIILTTHTRTHFPIEPINHINTFINEERA